MRISLIAILVCSCTAKPLEPRMINGDPCVPRMDDYFVEIRKANGITDIPFEAEDFWSIQSQESKGKSKSFFTKSNHERDGSTCPNDTNRFCLKSNNTEDINGLMAEIESLKDHLMNEIEVGSVVKCRHLNSGKYYTCKIRKKLDTANGFHYRIRWIDGPKANQSEAAHQERILEDNLSLKLYGCYAFMDGDNIIKSYIIMENLFYSCPNIDACTTVDFKGSTANRTQIAGNVDNYKCINLAALSRLKYAREMGDGRSLETIGSTIRWLEEDHEKVQRVFDQIVKSIRFLESKEFLDYSLFFLIECGGWWSPNLGPRAVRAEITVAGYPPVLKYLNKEDGLWYRYKEVSRHKDGTIDIEFKCEGKDVRRKNVHQDDLRLGGLEVTFHFLAVIDYLVKMGTARRAQCEAKRVRAKAAAVVNPTTPYHYPSCVKHDKYARQMLTGLDLNFNANPEQFGFIRALTDFITSEKETDPNFERFYHHYSQCRDTAVMKYYRGNPAGRVGKQWVDLMVNQHTRKSSDELLKRERAEYDARKDLKRQRPASMTDGSAPSSQRPRPADDGDEKDDEPSRPFNRLNQLKKWRENIYNEKLGTPEARGLLDPRYWEHLLPKDQLVYLEKYVMAIISPTRRRRRRRLLRLARAQGIATHLLPKPVTEEPIFEPP